MLTEASRELQRLYPGIRFHVFTWDGVPEGVIQRLKANGLSVRTIRQIIPDYTDAYLIAPAVRISPDAGGLPTSRRLPSGLS